MKTWITYVAAVALGFSATLLLGEFELYGTIVGSLVPVLVDIGIFMLFPMVFVMFCAGISSLRRHARTAMMVGTTILWSIVTAVFLSAAAYAIYQLLPFGFENLNIIASVSAIPDGVNQGATVDIVSMFVGKNAFSQVILSNSHLLPIIILALLVGYALKPNIEVIRPAYVVMNSFSEAMFRLARFFAVLGALFIGLLAANYFNTVNFDELFFKNLRFFAVIGIATATGLFVLLPLLYGIVTGFTRGNPYRILFGTISALIAAFFTGNHLYSTMVLLPTTRRNNQVQKRIAGTALPLYTIIGKGGSTMVATITMMAMVHAATGSLPGWKTGAVMAGICVMFSFLSSWSLGFESLFIMLAAAKFLHIQFQQLDLIFVALLPLLSGIGTLLDTAIGAFGAAYTSRMIVRPMATPYRELI